MTDYFNGDPDAYRFWSKVAVTANPDKCWIWQAGKRRKGYGGFAFYYQGKKMQIAHRIAFLLYFGINPGKLYVLHKCDNPPCCNPHHLFLDTHQDNIADMISKRRHVFGETHPKRVLTSEDVIEIHRLLETGEQAKLIGKKFGVTGQHISKIKSGKKWKYLSV